MLTAEEAEAIERRLLIDMAYRYGRLLEKSRQTRRNGGSIQMTAKTEKTEALAPATTDALIRVKQLPIIEEHLRALKDQIAAKTADASAMVCTDETLREVKAIRAALNRKFTELEEKRKAVKAQIMAPYVSFEAVYRECVTDQFGSADAELKKKIESVENGLKSVCEQNLRAYFAELLLSRPGVEWLDFERTGVTVDMASARAKTPKKLMEQLKLFVDGVASSVAAIEGMPDAAEIMVEYKATLNMAGSIAAVQQRHRQAEAERQAAEERARAAAERAETAPAPTPAPAAFAAPRRVQEAQEKLYQLTLCVNGSMDAMKILKSFLTENNYIYRSIGFVEVRKPENESN